MNPLQEKQALEALRKARADLDALEPLLKNVLARDDQDPRVLPGNRPADGVHRTAQAVCKAIRKAADAAFVARNVAQWLVEKQPNGAEDDFVKALSCAVVGCDARALPCGLCSPCYESWRRWIARHGTPGNSEKHLERRQEFEQWRADQLDRRSRRSVGSEHVMPGHGGVSSSRVTG